MLLQEGKEQVLLAQVVLLHVREVVEERAQLHHVSRYLAVAYLSNLLLHRVVAVNLLLQGDVFLSEGIYGMTRRDGGRPLQVDASVEYRRVQVAKVEDLLFCERVAVNQFLLHFYHLVVGDLLQGVD